MRCLVVGAAADCGPCNSPLRARQSDEARRLRKTSVAPLLISTSLMRVPSLSWQTIIVFHEYI